MHKVNRVIAFIVAIEHLIDQIFVLCLVYFLDSYRFVVFLLNFLVKRTYVKDPCTQVRGIGTHVNGQFFFPEFVCCDLTLCDNDAVISCELKNLLTVCRVLYEKVSLGLCYCAALQVLIQLFPLAAFATR